MNGNPITEDQLEQRAVPIDQVNLSTIYYGAAFSQEGLVNKSLFTIVTSSINHSLRYLGPLLSYNNVSRKVSLQVYKHENLFFFENDEEKKWLREDLSPLKIKDDGETCIDRNGGNNGEVCLRVHNNENKYLGYILEAGTKISRYT